MLEAYPWNTMISCEAHLLALKSYVLGDRLLASGFRLAIHNYFVNTMQRYNSPRTHDYYALVVYAFAHIPSDRLVLQFLDYHCNRWRSIYGGYMDDSEAYAQLKLPRAFILRTMHQLSDFQDMKPEEKWDRCHEEHDSDKPKEQCWLLHIEGFDERRGSSIFEKPEEDDDPEDSEDE